MRLGDCFVERTRQHDDHLFIVASDPDKNPDAVLLLSVTTLRGKKERVCVFNANEHEHPLIRHTGRGPSRNRKRRRTLFLTPAARS